MKFLIPLVFALLFIGCGESKSQQAPATNESQNTAVSPSEANGSAPVDANVTAAAPEEASSSVAAETISVDATALFSQKCASCHGAKAEKSALNKSQIIAAFSEQQIKDALKGYQNGTYGKEMKALMQGQAKGLNETQIDALAKYISGL